MTDTPTRTKLLQLRAQIDDLLGAGEPAPPHPVEVLWMRISEFARAHRYSAKTISQWCRLGMPHIGQGHHCRINVRAAEKWIAEGGATRVAKIMGRVAHTRQTG
jgi:hypothetical protein